jgi:hypothetical protein
MSSPVIGDAAVGSKVMRDAAAAKGWPGSVIRFGPTVEVPDAAPVATRGGRAESPKLTVPMNGVAWEPVAKARTRPAAEASLNTIRIEGLLLRLILLTSFEGAEKTRLRALCRHCAIPDGIRRIGTFCLSTGGNGQGERGKNDWEVGAERQFWCGQLVVG